MPILLRAEGKMGVDLTVQGSVSFTLTKDPAGMSGLAVDNVKATVTNGQVAGQGAWVVPFFQNSLQIQTFVQAVAGINWVQDAGQATSSVSMRPMSMVQAVGGMQAVYTLPDTDKHLQLFVQAQKSITGSSSSTQDTQASPACSGTSDSSLSSVRRPARSLILGSPRA